MAVFVIRRLVVSLFILLVSTVLMFGLIANSGDPLADLRTNTSPNKATLIAHRIEVLHLDQPVPQRYVSWLGRTSACVVPGQECDLGKTVRGQDVTALLGQAIVSTLRLVTASLMLAIFFGVTVGIVSALRQYSGFDYTITFSAFLFYSLPVFWVAVLLKQYLAIDVNNWYADPRIGLPVAVALAVASGLLWGAVLGGDARRKWLVRLVAAAATFGVLEYLSLVNWFERPSLGPVLITVLSFGVAVGITALVSGLKRRGVLYSALVTAGIGSLVQLFVTDFIQQATWASYLNLFLLALSAVAVAVGVGWALGGLDKPQAIRGAVLTALATGLFIVMDVLLRNLPGYARLVNGRVFATTGAETPNLNGTFWQTQLDLLTHLVLPMMAIMLISYASYSRYSRASMLEVMGQDYVRTARAKGLTERTVVMRHAFRNALIPLTTLAAVDFGVLIGGAIITETVFARPGMGSLFIAGLGPPPDPNPVMGFFLVVALSVVFFNMLADIAYAYLDPRIRLG